MAWNKPYTNISEDMTPFWDLAKEHKLVLWHCKVCGAWYWPQASCRNHANEPYMGNMEWKQASGRGKVFTYTVPYWAFHPGFKDEVPYVYAMIELDEGPLFPSNVIVSDPADVRVGLPVEVVFEDVDNEFSLPKFRPQRGGAGS